MAHYDVGAPCRTDAAGFKGVAETEQCDVHSTIQIAVAATHCGKLPVRYLAILNSSVMINRIKHIRNE